MDGFEITIVTSKPGRGGRRYAPYAFTEQGVAMLSSVLNSDRAIAVNIEIMRSFVRFGSCLRPTSRWRASSLVWSENSRLTIKQSSGSSRRFAN